MKSTNVIFKLTADEKEDLKAIAFYKKTTMTEIAVGKIKEVIAEEKKNGVLKDK